MEKIKAQQREDCDHCYRVQVFPEIPKNMWITKVAILPSGHSIRSTEKEMVSDNCNSLGFFPEESILGRGRFGVFSCCQGCLSIKGLQPSQS